MIDFHSFETFDPNGPGLGNLFGQVSPFEALGIWPSGDFRLAPGDGAVPALGYYLGAAFALDPAALRPACSAGGGARRRSSPASLAAVVALRARPGSAAPPTRRPRRSRSRAPLAALVIVLPLLRAAGRPRSTCSRRGGCSLLALANAPVGPTAYSPALTGLRPLRRRRLDPGPRLRPRCSTRNTASPTSPGSCAAAASASTPRARRGCAARPPPRGVRFVVTEGGDRRGRPSPACACAATRRSLPALGSDPAAAAARATAR